ncbi:hypothetical protein [uncultured Tateyamaria sp.]|uniref:DUF7210 family protein n=1 Tax=uncultured Tateyamaria sp. TaxID=455651 RepID=UPI002614176C|nr:hypothetical protein [uncultured Tateyamaria sp.]
MDHEKFEVTLIGPVKIGGKVKKAGDTALVTAGQALQLADAGALPPIDELDDVLLSDVGDMDEQLVDLEAKLAAATVRAEELDASLATVSGELATAREVMAALEGARDELVSERDNLAAKLKDADAKIAELEAAPAPKKTAARSSSAKPKG